MVLLVITAIVVAGATYSYFSYTNPGGPASTISSSPSTSQSTSTFLTGSNSSQSVSSSECAPSPGHTGNSSYTVTETGWPGCDCALVASNSQGMLYVSTNAKVGDDVCLAASLYDSDTVAFTITNSTGSLVLQTAPCIALGAPGTPSPTGDSCETDWNTAAPGESGGVVTVGMGAVTAGNYSLAAGDGTGSASVLEANFTLGPGTTPESSSSTSPLQTTSTSEQCVITGQADGFDLRVIWDSNQTPVVGAMVNATTHPDSVNGQPCGQPQSQYFTTSGGREWYSLGTYNIGGYSILVKYSGQSYTLTAGLSPLSTTCASLYLPSGRTNVTIAYLSSTCP